jgi:hypothetical protein
MPKKLLQINFKFDGAADELAKAFLPVAQPIADQPGLKWKVWCWNDEVRECAGEYLFEDATSVDAYLRGAIVEQINAHPSISDLSAKVFDVMEEPTAITRGPV